MRVGVFHLRSLSPTRKTHKQREIPITFFSLWNDNGAVECKWLFSCQAVSSEDHNFIGSPLTGSRIEYNSDVRQQKIITDKFSVGNTK